MNKFLALSAERRANILDTLALKIKLPNVSVEKDWWATAVLRALFALPYSASLSFKGGTSLSKCWNLIERFSEDVDIAVDREYLGFGGVLSKTQINDRLRRAACSFVRERLQFDLAKQLETEGVHSDLFSVKVNITSISTTDPEIIEIEYQTLFSESAYIQPVVRLEISGRSMSEPLQVVKLRSLLDEAYPDAPFAETQFEVQAVVPQRTFLEKICLLHEEFAKPSQEMRTERMSRHLYDLACMADTSIAEEALTDRQLFHSVVEHRRIFIGLKGFDYSTLAPDTISIVPPANIMAQWKTDYETMRNTMIYGNSPTFNKLIDCIMQLNEKINKF